MGNMILIVWFGAMGAAIGSFLNVVIYRLPRRESLVSPPSHCPKCNHKIRFHDNLPIFGWFVLGGKCRDCKQPISFRYPLIESIACLIVMTISALMLPVDITFVRPAFATFELPDGSGMTEMMISPMTITQVAARIVWVSTLLLFLLTLGMIDFDRQTLKFRGLVCFLIPFLILGAFFSFLFPVPWFSVWPFEGILTPFKPLRVPGVLAFPIFDLLAGLLCGGVLGIIVAKLQKIENRGLWFAATLAVGIFCGWQMTVLCLLLALLLNAVILFLARRSCPIPALLLAVFFANVWALCS